MMKIDDVGLNLIKRFEGCSLVPYLDAVGIPTIGYGNTRYENGEKVKMTDPAISPQRAEELLRYAVADFEKAVLGMVAVDLTQNQFNALVSFAFNLGAGSLKTSTLLQKLNQSDFVGAAAEFSRWHFAAKKPLRGLLRRRLAEAVLFLEN